MNLSSRSTIAVSLVSMSLLAFSAQAQEQRGGPPPGAPPHAARPAHPPGPPAAARVQPAARVYAGHPYRGRMAWDRGQWRHEVYQGREGWWWDVGGVRYYYPEQLDGPPTYISEDYVDDVYPATAAGYPPPAYVAAPPPPPPPADPAASAVGGAVVGGLLGGLLTGRAAGAAAGAVIGGATGAIAGATAASRPGYYIAEGNCYYRYPSGQYVLADQRACY
jgi:hypothetical protein